MTSITNVKVSNIRPKYQNLKEWMKDDNNVYIGRAGIVFIDGKRFPKSDSIWANPYKIGVYSREECIQKYKEYILDKINQDKNMLIELSKLRGKQLGCWCHPESCHGHILIDLIEKFNI